MPESALVRFVAGPDGLVTPDVARRLPGRGVWVAARRESVDLAVKRGAFSRSAKSGWRAPIDLSDQVDRLLRKRLLDGLGLARRAGELTSGFEKVDAAIRAGQIAWLIEASDSSADGRRKLGQSVHRARQEQGVAPRVCGVFSSEELSLALGQGNVIHVGFLVGRGVRSWAEDVERLAGFRPLLPDLWREGP